MFITILSYREGLGFLWEKSYCTQSKYLIHLYLPPTDKNEKDNDLWNFTYLSWLWENNYWNTKATEQLWANYSISNFQDKICTIASKCQSVTKVTKIVQNFFYYNMIKSILLPLFSLQSNWKRPNVSVISNTLDRQRHLICFIVTSLALRVQKISDLSIFVSLELMLTELLEQFSKQRVIPKESFPNECIHMQKDVARFSRKIVAMLTWF